ncbi:MAG: ATP-dependent sacrificial sulfur transferase LarE, partial [Bacteroidia bacterium]|nr:ATP-dependent sacrificial sulfur transferase LarE [Bacteroidia bacterium]
MTDNKSIILDSILKELRSFAIAFSGGVDSSFLVYRAKNLGKLNMTAVTIRTPYISSREINDAIEFAESHGINHKIIDLEFPGIIRHNPKERCYLCKKTLFSKIAEFASDNGYQYILDGTNADDGLEIRPGLKALKELSVRSPLAEAGLTKKEIRELLMIEGLPMWDKPSMACLLTRIPYETEVTEGMLRMIEKAEDLLFDRGYPGTRVRLHGEVARIECLPGYLNKIINDPEKQQIVSNLKEIGFRYISLDLEG